jgi:mono/diheme cytochrome c family protein
VTPTEGAANNVHIPNTFTMVVLTPWWSWPNFGNQKHSSSTKTGMRHLGFINNTATNVTAFVFLGLFALLGRPASSQTQKPSQNKTKEAQPSPKSSEGSVARGKYIVESIAMCGQCHTPNDPAGLPDRRRWLQGGPVPFQPPKADSNWPINAPRIGGTPLPASDDDLVKLLTTGIWTNGSELRPPMPQFRMEKGDAEAVVAYLKSFNPPE